MLVLFDIGGTNTRVAVSNDGQGLDRTETFMTPSEFEEGIEKLQTSAQRLLQGARPKVVVGGIAGSLKKTRTGLFASPNLPDWVDQPLQVRLAEIWDTPVELYNDAALAALGEAIYGAGQGYDIVAFLTISTGIGGARVVCGQLDLASVGFEPGHQIIDLDNSILGEAQCVNCSNLGDLIHLVSGRSVEARFNQHPKEINDQKVWEELTQYLAVGLNNTIVHWSPDIVILGGGMMKNIPLEVLQKKLQGMVKILPIPELKLAQLGDKMGLWGAMHLAKSALKL